MEQTNKHCRYPPFSFKPGTPCLPITPFHARASAEKFPGEGGNGKTKTEKYTN